MSILADLLPDSTKIFDPNMLGLIFIICAGGLFLVALILRLLKLRGVSRIVFVLGAVALVAYSSLVFVNIGDTITAGDWTVKDYADITLFGASIILLIYFLEMAISKR